MGEQRASRHTTAPLPVQHEAHTPEPLDMKDLNKTHVISPQGDLIIEYTDPSAVPHRWVVSSQLLVDKSPYFRALLDPEKFAEGRQLSQRRQGLKDSPGSSAETGSDGDVDLSSFSDLPTFKIGSESMLELCGAESIDLFLRIMCLESQADDTRIEFEDSLKSRSLAVIAKLIEIADWFNSPEFIRYTLRDVGYTFGKKDRSSQWTFGPALLRMKEDRTRQIIAIAYFLQSDIVCQTMTHTLLVAGSRFWVDGLERPATVHLRWRYLPDGFEEELYYRRQCVLNTITDLHAHFLRKYGALEDTDETKPTNNTTSSLGTAFSTSTHTRRYQCRAGLDNASQCDLFHLGQMTRFFSMRAKTVFIGSTLIDPEFNEPNSEDETSDAEDTPKQRSSSSDAPSDIIAIIASLKQYPDYQIDPNHQACGVRRRLLPIIPCIEKYISDPRGLLGCGREHWTQIPRSSWKTGVPADHTVGIRFAQITSVHFSSKRRTATTFPLREEAWLLFTARKRNWEA
ncbi:hypothetical protein N7492_007277 [Penicillium capsulatum]|uniref:BTB domain-containing protein n=1 Tax=Penicillium capsulatum TaxID=69766 RepID=A0A9W9LL52_9EURO|nr:hypothetical protein N7492_007277 [Penicillium capsulatum]KAJ6117116.1 hypothetical protein N7512_006841 [Penicillium capsulatum]